jgi:hypothetical protein
MPLRVGTMAAGLSLAVAAAGCGSRRDAEVVARRDRLPMGIDECAGLPPSPDSAQIAGLAIDAARVENRPPLTVTAFRFDGRYYRVGLSYVGPDGRVLRPSHRVYLQKDGCLDRVEWLEDVQAPSRT